MSKTTVVTALFDIGRDKLDGRTWDEYLDWFSRTLQLNCPMVVFVEEKTKDFVLKHRGDKPTKVITQKLEDVPFYKNKKEIERVISLPKYKHAMRDSDRIECNSSLYTIIQYSKFGWMKDACDSDWFDSEFFIWMDAGLSRFFVTNGPLGGTPLFDITKKFPTDKFETDMKKFEGTPVFEKRTHHYIDLYSAPMIGYEYFFDSRSIIAGGIWCGDKEAVEKIHNEVDLIFTEALKQNMLNNEQILLGWCMINKRLPATIEYNPWEMNVGKFSMNNTHDNFVNYRIIEIMGEE